MAGNLQHTPDHDDSGKRRLYQEFVFKANKLEFTADDGKSYFFMVEGQKPVKLGDGSFGIVYKIRDKENKAFAIKLFYASAKKDAKLRYNQERNFAKNIRRHKKK